MSGTPGARTPPRHPLARPADESPVLATRLHASVLIPAAQSSVSLADTPPFPPDNPVSNNQMLTHLIKQYE
jgi:hypothetical protein